MFLNNVIESRAFYVSVLVSETLVSADKVLACSVFFFNFVE